MTTSASRQANARSVAAMLAIGVRAAVLVTTAFVVIPALAADAVAAPSRPSRAVPAPPMAKRASFGREGASPDARHVADWVVGSADNQGMPFAIVDKREARVYVFRADGRLRGAAAALLGQAIGDDSVPGIGDKPLSAIRPEERTTPAGRFIAELGTNLEGKEILWIDYQGAVSMHLVVTSNAKEQRAQRLATPTPLDNRISYGCINVPVRFYETVVSPAFTGTRGVVYVLPETRPVRKFFVSNE